MSFHHGKKKRDKKKSKRYGYNGDEQILVAKNVYMAGDGGGRCKK